MAEGNPVKVGRDSTGVPLPLVYIRVGHVPVTASSTGATTSAAIVPDSTLVEIVSSQPFHYSTGASSIAAATVASSPWIPANTPTVIPMKKTADGQIHNRISVIGEVGGTAATVHIHPLGIAPNGG